MNRHKPKNPHVLACHTFFLETWKLKSYKVEIIQPDFDILYIYIYIGKIMYDKILMNFDNKVDLAANGKIKYIYINLYK